MADATVDPCVAAAHDLFARQTSKALLRVRAALTKRVADCPICWGRATVPQAWDVYVMTDHPGLRSGPGSSAHERRANVSPRRHETIRAQAVEHVPCPGCAQWRQLIDLARVEL